MIPRGDFDLMYVARLLEIFSGAAKEQFPRIHAQALQELMAIERKLATPNNEPRARRI